MNTERCPFCPLNADPDYSGVVCVALARPHPPYCWAMDPTHPLRNPAFAPVIVRKSTAPGAAAPPPAAATETGPPFPSPSASGCGCGAPKVH